MKLARRLKSYGKHSVTLKRFYVAYERWRCRDFLYPDWGNLLQSGRDLLNACLASADEGSNILIATGTGAHLTAATLESFLAVALTLRGAKVHILLCDSFLTACLMCEIGLCGARSFAKRGAQGYFCKGCFAPAYAMYSTLGVRVHRYSQLITVEEQQAVRQIAEGVPFERIPQYSLDGIAVGEHALAGALRFFGRGSLDGQSYAEAILRRYFEASLLTVYASRRLLQTINFRCTVFHHGIYVPQGIIGEVAREMGIRVVNWNVGYRKKCFIFTHHDTYHHMLINEPTSNWEFMPWDDRHEKAIMDYLQSRQKGTRDWIVFLNKAEENMAAIIRELGIDLTKPCIGLLTNVVWDAQLHYPANAFPSMLDWLRETIGYFAKRPDLQLIIRVHPAEITADIPSRQPVVAEVRKWFPVLPPNIFVVPPQGNLSTYALMQQCNAVIIYGTKTGVELTSRGIPVIVGGEAWIRNKGITIDGSSAEEYFRILDQLPFDHAMSPEQIQRARKYAYHFFFRRMIPLPQMEPTGGWPLFRVNVSSLEELLPGGTLGLDVICDGILQGTEFIYPAEKFEDGKLPSS